MKFSKTDPYGNKVSYLSISPGEIMSDDKFEKIISVVKMVLICLVMIAAIYMCSGYGLIFSGFILAGIWLSQIIREA